MWNAPFDKAMRRFVQQGALEIDMPDGTTTRYGEPGAEPIRVTVHDEALPRRLLLNPDVTLGEAYMNAEDGGITIQGDDIRGLLQLALRNRRAETDPVVMRVAQRVSTPTQRFLARNRLARSRTNVAHHYDLSGALYDLFLDADKQYSCGYFADPAMSLDEAQRAKKRHIAKKLCLRAGDRVLDIGCGWGGLAITLAQEFGARVVGVTLSEEQHRVARERVAAAGLEDRVDIRLQDYRDVEGAFDRIVSVGMFEHVGAAHFREYFSNVRDRLTPDGVALIHTIGSLAPPRATSPWIRKYIFPGGYIPSLSEVTAAVERETLEMTDVEVWRRHYATTLRHWRERFEARIDEVRALYDDRFCRMWRYYLTASELSFVEERLVVFQLQMARDKFAVPLTREYLYRDDASGPVAATAPAEPARLDPDHGREPRQAHEHAAE